MTVFELIQQLTLHSDNPNAEVKMMSSTGEYFEIASLDNNGSCLNFLIIFPGKKHEK